MDTTLLKRLCAINAPPTHEGKVRELIAAQIKDHVDDLIEDNYGNLIAHKKGAGKRFMLAAHMDQIGFLIHNIEPGGCLRFTAVGGLIPFTLIGQRVVINDTVIGTIGVDADLEAGSDLSKVTITQLFIDIGATSREDAENQITIGDFGTFQSEFYENDTLIMSKALDDRIGCYMLIHLIKENLDSHYDLYFAFTTQEEVGTRGATTAAYGIQPHYGISIDITPAGDLPGTKNSTASIGKGVGIKLMDPSLVIDPAVKKMFTEAAQREGIPYQFEVMKRGGTDAGPMQTARSGVKSGAISIPTRNAHTANEVIRKSDVDAGLKLLRAVLTVS